MMSYPPSPSLHLIRSVASQAIELDETYVKAYLKRAAIHTTLEKFEEAVRDYEAASKLDPSNHGMETRFPDRMAHFISLVLGASA